MPVASRIPNNGRDVLDPTLSRGFMMTHPHSRSKFVRISLPLTRSVVFPTRNAQGTHCLQVKYAVAKSGDDEEGEVLCDTLFSLAYGALLLLSHTTLRLIRGRRYGILGTNGSGKSTLMRQLRDGKVENFPPQSQLRCVMVEHSLQGEDTSVSVIDFIASGEPFRTPIATKLIQRRN